MSRVSGIVKLVKNAEKLSKTVSKSKPKRNIDLPNVFDTNLKTPKTNATSIFENSTKIPSIESPFKLPEGITFTKQPKRILKVDGVKQEFPLGEIEADFLVNEMREIKKDLLINSKPKLKLLIKNPISHLKKCLHNYKLYRHSAKLSTHIKKKEYNEIANYINLFDGRYIDIWHQIGELDGINNTHKLALFLRSIRREKLIEKYKTLDRNSWEICMDGIINRPPYATPSVTRYKYTSSEINKTSDGTISGTKQNNLDCLILEKLLDSQRVRHDITVHRGEGDFLAFDKKRAQMLEKLINRLKANHISKYEIKETFKYIMSKDIEKSRFMSTALFEEDAHNYAKKVLWHIKVPKGSKGSMIEGYNVERASESELLLQRNSKSKMNQMTYNGEKNILEIWADYISP